MAYYLSHLEPREEHNEVTPIIETFPDKQLFAI